MLGFKDNIVVATHILANAGRMAPAAQAPLAAFVTAVTKSYLKSRDTRLADIAAFGEAVGKSNLLAIADKLTTKEAVAVLCRIDPLSADRARTDPAWARARLAAVLTGEETPDLKPSRSPARRRLNSKPLQTERSVLAATDAFSAKRREKSCAAD